MADKQIIFSKYFLMILISLFLFSSCKPGLEEKGDPAYISSVKQWHKNRIERLKKENGWLNLVGLFWLHEGENKFGSAKSNDVVFPEGKSPDLIGTFTLKDSVVTVNIAEGVNVVNDDKPVSQMIMVNDMSGKPTVLKYGDLRWFIIKRGDRYGIRLRDVNAPLVKKFTDIDTYPINSDWKIEAKFVPYNPPKKLAVPNILGMVDEETASGSLVFQIDGKEYSLDPVDEDGELFIIFADKTSGKETYGAGRFLYADKPGPDGKVILDFNKAYNPPCIFTKYATCPLPPQQNHLQVEVTAGEKMFHGGAHE